MTMSTDEFKVNSNKSDFAVNVTNVAKHDFVNRRIQGQFKQSRHCCKCTKCGQTRHVKDTIVSMHLLI